MNEIDEYARATTSVLQARMNKWSNVYINWCCMTEKDTTKVSIRKKNQKFEEKKLYSVDIYLQIYYPNFVYENVYI